jgi:hypothetical protein
MFSRLGPIDVHCDAPSYRIVQACRRVGIESPEDVRWCRVSHFLSQVPGWKGLFHTDTWKKLLGRGGPEERTCSCGHKLPNLDRITFTFSSGGEVTYLIGQCGGCRTIFWEDL